MDKRLGWLILLAFLPLALALGCGELGKVDQGRVVAFDEQKRTVTLIQDKKAEPGNPDYNTLPPHTYSLPKDPSEMGPVPKVGKRMKLDVKAREIVIFDPATQNFKNIAYTLIDQKEGVDKNNPLVAGKKFPMVDKTKKAITIYSARQKILTTFTVPEEYFAMPDDTWDAGDEVRIYYKEPGKALRFMNITRTDIFKK
ncbi:MAG: DUF4881 domain-containing protein [Deltaproteobacteria bacterium]|nr:DUF4881 domain-containing protein [Deltaproteobacteria bacterium]